ncbi:glutamine-synthetase adenylyltransferase [Arenibacterium halophilum]|uniref:Glutamine-synthetase adenylyltransferase n=1 Tax=Arenibacterium halophilum TaxID=2583821 RepID=A0ABY2XCF4_9RHOB|nr:glutamine-synthetase adenylyltransferase [Arenibacterium halophilum]TMV14705.1 glutamine-synthetase adenylyltransferase [Arenibacterium halophilum]
MRFSDRITRSPRPMAPDLGAEAAAALPDMPPELREVIVGAAASSPFLNGLIRGHAAWLEGALDDPEAAVVAEYEAIREASPDALNSVLRRAKARIALMTALADLAGVWRLETVTGTLSDFAALACDAALQAEIAALIRRGKLPGQGEDDVASAAGLFVLAMGKMGAGELNYSSDIDLICLFDESRYDPDDYHEARQSLVRATRNMCARLSDRTAEGYVFRTDLRLRPDPSVTPVCMSMAAAETYYESLGRTWERAAYIKAHPCAGDTEAGARFITALRPFIWRRHLDFAAIQDAHDMRLRIRENKGTGGALTLSGHDMKLGRGGIREIEFFTQTRQLIAGGRDESLRLRGTVPGLRALTVAGWVTEDVSDRLADHYRAHREIEHRIQMVHDAQTHKLPTNPEEFTRVACLTGMDEADLRADLLRRLNEVHELTEGFFAPDVSPVTPTATPEFDTSICRRWPRYPALRSQRAQQIFERLRPEMLARLARTARPEEALVALDGFMAGLPAGVQLFALFEANPQLIDLLIDIVGTSPALAGYLSRNAGVFDAVIGGDFFTDWPAKATLAADLTARLELEPDYEARLDTARRWAREWRFRVGVHHLRGLIDGYEAGTQYADIADAVITALFPVVTDHFAAKHGTPPGRGAAVLGMGSLGLGRLNAASDLDLIVIYDPDGVENSEGRRPLPARTYYARLTQAMITALTAPMAEGRLYEVDMRLRPSGNQGPVATSWASFRDYQETQAWVWEHLALTRARVIAAHDAGLRDDIEAFRQKLLRQPQDRDKVLQEVSEMRARIAEARAPASVWDVKTGAGRLQDIELIAQAGALTAGLAVPDVPGGLQGAVETGWLSPEASVAMAEAAALYWSVHAAVALLAGSARDMGEPGQGAADFLCRATGAETVDDLAARLEDAYRDTARRIATALGEDEQE